MLPPDNCRWGSLQLHHLMAVQRVSLILVIYLWLKNAFIHKEFSGHYCCNIFSAMTLIWVLGEARVEICFPSSIITRAAHSVVFNAHFIILLVTVMIRRTKVRLKRVNRFISPVD